MATFDLRACNGTIGGLAAIGLLAMGFGASAQEFLANPIGTTPTPYAGAYSSTPQIQSGAAIEQYFNPGGMTVINPPPLFGPAAGVFSLVPAQSLVQSPSTQQIVGPGSAPLQQNSELRTNPQLLMQAPATTQPTGGASATTYIPLPGGTELATIKSNPVQVIPLPNQPPILIPMNPETMTGTMTGGGASVMTGTAMTGTAQQVEQAQQGQATGVGGTTAIGSGQTIIAEPMITEPATGGTTQIGESETTEQAAGNAEMATEEEADAADATQVAESDGHSDEHHDDDDVDKERKKQEEALSTQRAMANMAMAQQQAESQLGFKPIADPTGEHTSVEHQQIMGAEVMAQISQLGASINNKVSMVLPEAIEVKVDKEAVRRLIEEEERRIEKEKKELKKRLERERKRLEREKKKIDKQRARNERDQKYRDRRAREDQQRRSAEDLNKQNEDLKKRAERLDQNQKDLDERDKKLRADEQKARANDPNCQGAECRGIQAQRTALSGERTNLVKAQGELQKDAQKFNGSVREWQADQRELDDLKDRGYGMDEGERAAHRQTQRVDAAKQDVEDIERARADLTRQAKWLEAEGKLDEDTANELRKQWKALEGAEGKASEALRNAEADLLKAQAEALGLGDVYKEAAKNFEAQSGDRPRWGQQVPALQDAMRDAQRLANASQDTLDQVSKMYGDAIDQVDAIESRLGADPRQPDGLPPVNASVGSEMGKLNAEFNKISDELKKLNPQGFMATKEWRDANKERVDTARALEQHERRLQELGDSDLAGVNAGSNKGPDEPLEYRSQAELARRHSFTYTGPEALRDEVMKERAALEKATGDFLAAQDKVNNIREGSADYQKGKELWKRADELQARAGFLDPLADVNQLSQDVQIFNSNLLTGLPRGADGAIDENAVIDRVQAMANGQMALLQNGVALEDAERRLAANPNGTDERKLVSDLKIQQREIIDEVGKTGISIDTRDGKFVPSAILNGNAEMWNTARDQTKATLEELDRNRQAAGMEANPTQPPGEAGKGSANRQLDREAGKQKAEQAELDKVAGAPPMPSPDVARSPAGDLNQLTNARNTLKANIDGLNQAVEKLPADHPAAPALIATRTSLEAAAKGVDGAITKVEQKIEQTKLRTQQLTNAAKSLEKNINAIDDRLVEIDGWTPEAAALTATRDSLEAAARSVDHALKETEPRPADLAQPKEIVVNQAPETATGTAAAAGKIAPLSPEVKETLTTNHEVLTQQITGLEEQIATLPVASPQAVALSATRDALKVSVTTIEKALTAPVAAAPVTVTPARRAELEKQQDQIVRERLTINERLKSAPADDPEATKLRERSAVLGNQLDAIERELSGPPSPVKVTPTEVAAAPPPAVTTAAAAPVTVNRRASLEKRQEQIVQQRLAVNERLKSLPADDPEAKKLRDKSALLGNLLEEIERELADPPATTTAAAPAATSVSTATAAERDPELTGLRRQMFDLDEKAKTLTIGSADWLKYNTERTDLLQRYVARYTVVKSTKGETAQQQPTAEDPIAGYFAWLERDILPALKGSAVELSQSALTNLVMLFGPELAEEAVHNALDETLEVGDGDRAEIFLDALMRRMEALARERFGAEAGRSIAMGRAQILTALLGEPAIAKSTTLSDEVKSRLATVTKEMRAELGKELAAADNKPDLKLGLLGELAALSQLDGSDLGPLATEIAQELDRLAKAPLKSGAEGELRAATLQRLAGLLESLRPDTAEVAERLSKSRIGVIGQLRRQMTLLAETAPPERAAVLRTEAAKLLLREAAALLSGGDTAGALELLRRAGAETTLSASERDMALISVIDRALSDWSQSDDAARAKLGPIEKLAQERDQALERLSLSANPAEAAAATLARVRTAQANGDRATAERLLDEALKHRADDPVLQAEKLTLTLSDPSQPASPERIDQTLAKLPEALRLPAGLIALDRLIESGGAEAATALIEKLRALTAGTEDAAFLGAYLDARKALALAGTSEGKVTVAEVKDAITKARASLQPLAADNPLMAAELERLDALAAQIEHIDTLEKALAGGTTPAVGFDVLAREALSIGRLDLAEKALQRLGEVLFDGDTAISNTDALRSLRNAGMILETVRRRAAQGDLTQEQRALFEGFLGRAAPIVVGAIDKYLAERVPAAERTAARAATDPKLTQAANQRLAELRVLERMRWMAQASMLSPEQRATEVYRAEDAATQQVNAKIVEIRTRFAGLAKAVNEDATKSAELDKALAELDALRARRDGIIDFRLTYAAGPEFDPRDGFYGFLEPRTARDAEIRRLEGLLIGAEPGETANDLWQSRRDQRNYQARKGARERLLVDSDFEPTDRELRNNPTENGDYWLKMRLLQREVIYLDRRRAELVLEDPTRPCSAGTDLLNKLIAHESKVLTDLVKPSNALSEMLQDISGYGADNRALAKTLSDQLPQNEINGWLGEIEQARAGGDVQKGFLSLVRLRDASLAGEIDAFVNYLQMPWYKAGPARAYNLLIGMEATQTAVEAATVESSRLHATLIRAANNLPETLSAEDRTLLSRHGFLEDGKYVMPEHVRITPTTAGSEFSSITQEGALGTVDRVLNAQHAAELVATVAIPGGIAGRLGRAVTAELLGTSRLLAHGLGLAAETAAFTGLSRAARAALDPELLATREFWSGRALLAEYGHNLLTLGVLKIKGVGTEAANAAIKGVTRVGLRTQLEGAARAADFFGEAALLTGLNGALSSNSISRESFLENVLIVSLLRATHKAGDIAGGALGLNRTPEGSRTGLRELPKFARSAAAKEAAEIRYNEWLDAYYIPARRLMEQFKGDWAAARKAYTKGEISESQMRRMVEMRRWVVDTLAQEILGELKGEVEAFGSENLTSDYDISFVGPMAQVAVILFNARFNSRWGAAADIGGRETGVTLDTNAYTRSEHLNYLGGARDVWLQDSFAHLAARKYLGDAEWAAYRSRVEAAADTAKSADLARMLDSVEAQFKDLKLAIEAKKAELTGTVAEADLQITAENRLYEDTLREVADLIDRHQKAGSTDKETLAQEIRNAQSRALFYAQEAYNTQAAITHVVTTIQAGKRSITVESLLGKDPPKLNVPLTVDQARQRYIEQISNMMKELSHGGDGEKMAGKAAKYFIRALDAAKIAGLDITHLESVIRATVEINDVRADMSKVKEALAARFGEAGAEAYLKAVSDGIAELNKAFFGSSEARTAANDNKAATGSEAPPPEPPPVPPPVEPASGSEPASQTRVNDPNAETAAGAAPKPATIDPQAGGITEVAAADRSAYDSGLQELRGDPVFARWLEQAVTTKDTLRQLALIGLTRSLLDPADRLQADVALSTAEGLINLNPELAGINLLEVARYVNLHAGRSGPGETGAAGSPNAAQLAVEALLQINPTAHIAIRDLVAAGRLDGTRAREALNGARSTLARQGGEITDATDALDRHPLTSYTADPLALLGRIDGTYLVQRPRAGVPGDAEFFAANDLLPRLTIEVGGQRFHATEPFRGPDGRVSVVAFQETSEGLLVPRTFYLSGEHGVWRAAIALAGGLISKGPLRLVYEKDDVLVEVSYEEAMREGFAARTQFVNESVVDLGAEMQGILSRWASVRGVRELDPAAMERAFYGHLERGHHLDPGAEFQAFVTRSDVERTLVSNDNAIPENLQPDLATGPLDTWRVDSHVYGMLDGATYLSRDGSVTYVVLRDAQGRVFVPSIQDAKVGLTPFGTRWAAYETTLNSTPMVHGASAYEANDNYVNNLNRMFR